jgi:dCMP deaminase
VLIGLTGFNAAGKGVVADILKERSFYYLSLSDVLRNDLKRRKKPVTRQNLIESGNALRARRGSGVLGRMILDMLEEDRHYIIDSIRHPDEVEELQARSDFFLLSIEAKPEVRFQRIRERARESDPQTLAEFNKLEAMELKNEAAHGQQLNACRRLADRSLQNNSNISGLEKRILKLLPELFAEYRERNPRPNWDEYFMNIAKQVSTRSNCIKRKVAAIVVKDRRIVSTGYNGTPRGVKNCDEGGCARCNSFATGGSKLDECLCSHGEENAIVQASYHGISLTNSTMYTTFSPCLICSKMIINSGIQEVVYNADYPLNNSAKKMLMEARVKLRKVKHG